VARVECRTPAGTVALTFDDGPHPASTPAVLDLLGELAVPATFFFVGRNAAQHASVVQRARDEGHAIGSHSLSHPQPAEISRRELLREYDEGRRAVSAAAGTDVRLFRPPYGHLGLSSAIIIRTQRLVPWLWTVDPKDWRPCVTGKDVASVGGAAKSGDVILLHDWVEQPVVPEALDRSATLEALPLIVRKVRERGLTFVTVAR
jgi:peptidoglycan/xylan/chitin deacetylase (PgdA/CDA1 family)